MENLPTAHGARARWRTWHGCLRSQIGAHSTPRHWTRLFFTGIVAGWRLRLRDVVIEVSESRGARPRAPRPVKNRPSAHGVRTRWRTSWRGCLRGQHGARSTLCRCPMLFFYDTAPGRRLRSRKNVIEAFESGDVRPAQGSPRGEPADRTRSTRALADLALLSLRPTRGALHPTRLAEALLQLHRARLAAAASK